MTKETILKLKELFEKQGNTEQVEMLSKLLGTDSKDSKKTVKKA